MTSRGWSRASRSSRCERPRLPEGAHQPGMGEKPGQRRVSDNDEGPDAMRPAVHLPRWAGVEVHGCPDKPNRNLDGVRLWLR
jgi:hypothetical protein